VKRRIPLAEPVIGDEEIQYVMEAVKSGWVSSKGPFIDEFEKSFSSYIGVKHGIATSNGTAALHLALLALGIGKGDDVLVPSFTFVATANAVKYTGAEPVFVDSHPEYWCLNPSEIEKRVNRRTKAIIAVHLYGHPCHMTEVMRAAKDHKLHVIEDCAEAHGAEYNGIKVGSFGVINCFSFYGNKIITTGEGGMCLTDDDELAEKMRILTNHGMNPNKKYWHDIIGFNYRMTNLQAALGVAQVKRIDSLVAKKRKIAAEYNELLSGLSKITLPKEMPWAKSTYWLYSILLKNQLRDNAIKELEKQGIETRPFFYPLHTLPIYAGGGVLPISEKLSAMGISLPSGPQLEKDQIQYVAESLIDVVESATCAS
jgi:perosamine synthetase